MTEAVHKYDQGSIRDTESENEQPVICISCGGEFTVTIQKLIQNLTVELKDVTCKPRSFS